MSLINQVLNDLEKRGATTPIGEATIRVVPMRQGRGRIWWLLGLVVVLLTGLAWFRGGIEIRFNGPSAGPKTAKAAAAMSPASQPVVAVEAAQAASAAQTSSVAAASIAAGTVAVEKAAAIQLPVINSVSPNPAISLGVQQAVTVNGKNFAPDATITLHAPDGKALVQRKIVMQDQNRIVISANFSDMPGNWGVEVVNARDQASAPFAFAVQMAPAVAKAGVRAKPASPVVAAQAGERAAPVGAAQITQQKTPDSVAGISKQPSQVTPQQQAEIEFRKAYELMQQGQISAAVSGYETALKLDAGHAVARQALVRLLLENKRNADAERLLQEGLQLDPKQSGMAMLLARMQVGRNELEQALETMQKSLPYAEKQADYQAYVAALLQRKGKHQEAIIYFQNAVQLSPQSGVWQMGLAISLRAEQRNAEARDAYTRALETRTLNAELQSFVAKQLKEL